MTMRFDLDGVDGTARAGTATTARGSFTTPCFMPVGTRGAVRTVSAVDLEDLGAQVVLANTYHLMLRPGVDVVAAAGELHGFTGWPGHVLTDSGGYQVFSLSAAVDDDGVSFRSTYDGSTHRLTPEGAVAAQEALGADIAMVLDVCPALPAPADVVRLAVDRTAAWAARSRRVHEREGQALFGIVQGGTDERMRAESAHRTVEVGFDGYAVGGLSVGEPRQAMLDALAAALAVLPPDRPRYLMGVGDPVGLVEAVGLGVDLFDCVLPTRLARHGTALTAAGRLHVRNAAYLRDDRPLDPTCACAVCARWSRSYLRHLHLVGEPGAARLLTMHNLAWTFAFVALLRRSVLEGTFCARRAAVLATWAPAASDEAGSRQAAPRETSSTDVSQR